MSTLTRKESRPFLDLFDWMDSPLTVFRPFTTQGMRMEDFVKDGHYTVRAELPGVDPAWHASAEGLLLLPVGEHVLLQDGNGSIASLGGGGDRISHVVG